MRFRHSGARILIVDDQPANVTLLEKILESAGYESLVSTTDPTCVPALCARETFHLVLLDLQMPEMDGYAVLERLRDQGSTVPVLVLTADATTPAKRRALSLGASAFVHKPLDVIEVRLSIANLLETRYLQLRLEEQNSDLETRVHERTSELEDARLEMLERLALAGEYRDDDTQEHAQRVGRTSALLAVELGLPGDEVELLRRAAPLHDIGKIGVPDAILLKPGPLTAAEFAEMKSHTRIGASILSGSRSPLLRLGERIALTHHERWDGGGYPVGLREADIPVAGRIVAVADVFDALSHARPYKPAWPLADTVAKLKQACGSHFDPAVIAGFASLDHESLLAPMASREKEERATGPGRRLLEIAA